MNTGHLFTAREMCGPWVFLPKNQGDEKTTAMFGKVLMEHISKEIEHDVPIWENKEYVEHPVLTKDDGPIAAWRNWCQQFYAELH